MSEHEERAEAIKDIDHYIKIGLMHGSEVDARFTTYEPKSLGEEYLNALEALERFERAFEAGHRPKLSNKQQRTLLEAMHSATYVYFILCESAGLVKIGKTSDPKKRFGALCTQSPVPLRMLCCFRSHDQMEGFLHAYFAEQRHHGEWFRLTDEMVDMMDGVSTSGPRQLTKEILRWFQNDRDIV